MPVSKRKHSKTKEEAEDTPTAVSLEAENSVTPASVSDNNNSSNNNTHDLILTSEKSRGVFECDYCHADISQLPRIRCAVCVDFDLCLDCFAGTQPHADVLGNPEALKKGYRVCESTRYPIFPSTKKIIGSINPPPVVTAVETQQKEEKSHPSSAEVEKTTSKESASEAGTSTEAKTSAISTTHEEGEDKMEVDDTSASQEPTTAINDDEDIYTLLPEEPSKIWTVEEDLRLLEGIRAHGLGNWIEISESVSGQGSVGKTPRRCQERYFDDFLGRYGHIVPPYTLLSEEDAGERSDSVEGTDEQSRVSKRSSALLRSPNANAGKGKRYKTIPTESIEGYDSIWPKPYIPPIGVEMGQEVGRDVSSKAEQIYVKTIAAIDKAEDIEKIRKEWAETRLRKPNGPTVLPPRPDDAVALPGSELAGFMPRREDFDVEWENDAEQAIADMEFVAGEPEEDRALKLQVLEIYNSKLDEREQRKRFILSRKLYDYRKIQSEHEKLPPDERDLVHRMRVFERFHTPEEHKTFVADLLKAKRLRKEIAKLQTYRRLGIRTMAEAEQFELDKQDRQARKNLQASKNSTDINNGKSDVLSSSESSTRNLAAESTSSSLWKTYRTGDRRIRKSINRGSSTELAEAKKAAPSKEEVAKPNAATSKDDPMEIDSESLAQKSESPQKATPTKESTPNRTEATGLISSDEQELCSKIDITSSQYIEIKKAIIFEALQSGLLDREGSAKRTLIQIDVERRGTVIDFLVRAGWISSKAGSNIRTLKPDVVAPPETPSSLKSHGAASSGLAQNINEMEDAAMA